MAYQLPHETSTKRKFNDYAAASTARMRHNEILFNSSLKTPIQFFVRMFSGGKTLVIQAYSSDTVASVHWKIHSITGIRPIRSTSAVPAMEQRLIYRGKQLELSQTLLECGVQNDDTLQLMSDLNLVIHDLCNCNDDTDINANVTRMTKMLTDFLANTPKDGADGSEEYLQMFIYFCVPAALVKLYISPSVIKKQAAHGCVCQFIDNCRILFTDPTTVYRQFAPIFFEFCTILRGAAGVDDTLYIFCRSSLAAMMKGNVHDVKHVLRLQDIFPFVHELATRLSHALELSVQLAEFIQLSESDVREFIQFMHRVKCAIRRQKAFGSLVSFPSLMQDEAGNERSEIKGVHHVFCDLLEKSELCLKELERQLGLVNIGRGEPIIGYNCKILFTDPTTVYRQFAPIFFEFCTNLRGAVGVDDTLYIFCRSSLAAMMKRNVHDVKHVLRLQDIFPFVHELATRLSHALELSVQLAEFIQLSEIDVREFIQFMHRVKCAIRRQKAFGSLVSFPSLMQDEAGNERSEIKGMHHVFCDLLEKSELCLKELERQLGLVNIGRGEPIIGCWSQYLLILKELESISKLYKGLNEMFWEKMRQRRVALCFLIDASRREAQERGALRDAHL
ncbi:E3 ubiquitin-protein ligase UPL5-like [Solanum stenotomum]|uniref:E3 ubiquitin-protein ligase UPL5-like n=1 Tax=Solanum stenotomum TaxID=172797 RepID=UPI0020D0A82C|nr:E3 ubiquitin-protein ligase UPL5-like [Solanum stenotomum]